MSMDLPHLLAATASRHPLFLRVYHLRRLLLPPTTANWMMTEGQLAVKLVDA
jgi:hypothetical protein